MTLIEEDFEDTLVIVQRHGSESVIAIEREGELPRIRTAGHHAADVTPIRQVVRDQLGLDTIVLDCLSVSVTDGVVHRLLTLESLGGRSDATGISWVALQDARHFVSRKPWGAVALDRRFVDLAEPRRPPDGRDWTVP